jgi:hypothetical protein
MRTTLAGLLVVVVATTACANRPLAPLPTTSDDRHDDRQVVAVASAADLDAAIPTAWFDLQLKLVKETPGFAPPVAARVFGYTGVALYESVVHGMPEHRSLAGQLNGLTALPRPSGEVHWPAVANSALATITRQLFTRASSQNQSAVDALDAKFAQELGAEIDADVLARSTQYGQTVAAAIYDWSKTDGGHDADLHNYPSDYAPPVGPGLWSPTPRKGSTPLPALLPYWGANHPFALKSGEECAPPGPPPYSEDPNSAFYAEAKEARDAVNDRTLEEEHIALFWEDGITRTATPAGHSVAIVTQLIREDRKTLAFAAEAYAKLGIAMNDAFIGCWHAKYQHNLLRPVTSSRAVMDKGWRPLVGTPPFPEFPSGHSTQAGAVAVVLSQLFGPNYAFTDHTHDQRGLAPRSFTSFDAMAEEAAMSRLYGGIHFRSAIELGLEQGRCIGEKVLALKFT